MSRAEITAHKLYHTLQLNAIDEEVKKHLMILLISEPKKPERKRFSTALESLEGAWENDGVSAESEIESLYNARVSGETRKGIEL